MIAQLRRTMADQGHADVFVSFRQTVEHLADCGRDIDFVGLALFGPFAIRG
jgi:hypothetical protein